MLENIPVERLWPGIPAVSQAGHRIQPEPRLSGFLIGCRIKQDPAPGIKSFFHGFRLVEGLETLGVHKVEFTLHRQSVGPFDQTRIRTQIEDSVQRGRHGVADTELRLEQVVKCVASFEGAVNKNASSSVVGMNR